MESHGFSSVEASGQDSDHVQSQDRINEIYAKKAVDRLDELFRQQDKVEELITRPEHQDKELTAEGDRLAASTPEKHYRAEHEVTFDEDFAYLTDSKAQETDILLQDQEKTTAETIQALRKYGIDLGIESTDE